MTTTPPLTVESSRDHIDDEVVESIVKAVLEDPPRSFFLFAGAGSGKTHTLKEVLLRLTGQV
ncbi:MAG TPA: hypothetical protein PLA94_14750, partial [Myxococcota bacterium]|nr:hypothetical protein [Myxococcota bacterium]